MQLSMPVIEKLKRLTWPKRRECRRLKGPPINRRTLRWKVAPARDRPWLYGAFSPTIRDRIGGRVLFRHRVHPLPCKGEENVAVVLTLIFVPAAQVKLF